MTDKPETHARSTDPDTSHMAVPANLSAQAFRVLHAYMDGNEWLDHEAYIRAGMGGARAKSQRCSDLRLANMIERTSRGTTPSGHWGWRCRITQAGLDYLAFHKWEDFE